MGYRVVYSPEREANSVQTQGGGNKLLFSMAFFLLFLAFTVFLWPEGRAALQKLLFSGDAAVTTAALENLAWELEMGEPIAEALEEFCREIIINGNGN